MSDGFEVRVRRDQGSGSMSLEDCISFCLYLSKSADLLPPSLLLSTHTPTHLSLSRSSSLMWIGTEVNLGGNMRQARKCHLNGFCVDFVF